VVHVEAGLAADDIETINTELILADLQTLEKALPAAGEGGRKRKDRGRLLAPREAARSC
jgi:ribosome-binding ATPase YchF (GTP1/OBG family)